MSTDIPDALDQWTFELIEKLIEEGTLENERLDFKANLPEANVLSCLVCSYANAKGGFIVLGVKERNKRFFIEGIENDIEISHKFGQKLRVHPPIDYEIPKIIEIAGSSKVLVVFRIEPSSLTPHIPLNMSSPTFYKRTNQGNEYMRYDEIKEAFTKSTDVLRSIHDASARILYQETRKKKYFIPRILSYYDRFLKSYETLKSAIRSYRSEPSELLERRVSYSADNAKGQLEAFMYVAKEDIKPILDSLNNPRVQDKFPFMMEFYKPDLVYFFSNVNPRSSEIWNEIKHIDEWVEGMEFEINELKAELDDQ